jgi:hypothetical protein
VNITRVYLRTDPSCETNAVHLTNDESWDDIAEWCGGRLVNHRDATDEYTTVLYIGDTDAVEGDWIVEQRTGFHVWVPDGFDATWAEVPR